MKLEELEALPTGRVIKRVGKKKLRIFKPRVHFKCEVCYSGNHEKVAKWVRGGNLVLLTLCLRCALDEINHL